MEYKLINKVLEIKLVDRITYDTASSFEDDLFNIVNNNNDFETLLLDANNLIMISSAGLRVILKLSKEYPNLSIINVIPEVYEVFQMTGFTAIIDIKKAYRNISLDNATLIGDGFFSKVYRLNKDTIVKVFVNESTTLPMIEKELGLAKRAFILGVPTAISFDIVKVNEYYGVIFEMLDAGLLRDVFKDHPEKYDKTIIDYANLLKKITTTQVSDTSVPMQSEIASKNALLLKDKIDIKDYDRIHYLLSTIIETHTFLHNDCHYKNIMVSNDELFLIDMETFSQGNPIFEFAGLAESNLVFTDFEPEKQYDFFKLSPELIYKVYYDVTRRYFINLSDLDYDMNILKIRTLAYISILSWIIKYDKDHVSFFNFCYDEVKRLIYQINDLTLIF